MGRRRRSASSPRRRDRAQTRRSSLTHRPRPSFAPAGRRERVGPPACAPAVRAAAPSDRAPARRARRRSAASSPGGTKRAASPHSSRRLGMSGAPARSRPARPPATAKPERLVARRATKIAASAMSASSRSRIEPTDGRACANADACAVRALRPARPHDGQGSSRRDRGERAARSCPRPKPAGGQHDAAASVPPARAGRRRARCGPRRASGRSALGRARRRRRRPRLGATTRRRGAKPCAQLRRASPTICRQRGPPRHALPPGGDAGVATDDHAAASKPHAAASRSRCRWTMSALERARQRRAVAAPAPSRAPPRSCHPVERRSSTISTRARNRSPPPRCAARAAARDGQHHLDAPRRSGRAPARAHRSRPRRRRRWSSARDAARVMRRQPPRAPAKRQRRRRPGGR